jgi:hypothetical protein
MNDTTTIEAIQEPEARRRREPALELAQGPRLLYDRKSAAYQLSISVRSLDYLVEGKKLLTRRLGKKVMISHAELVRFAKADHFSALAQ